MKERKDKIKNTLQVTKEVIKQPLWTQREIAKSAWVGLWTANRVLKELEQTRTESQILDNILWMDDEIIALTNWMTLDLIKEKIEQGKALTVWEQKVLSDIANNSTKRKAIFDKRWEEDNKKRDITIQI